MKKIIFTIGLFLVLIGIWSFSWAYNDSVLLIDVSTCGSQLGTSGILDITNDLEDYLGITSDLQLSYDNCLIFKSISNGDTFLYVFIAEEPFVYDSTRQVITTPPYKFLY